MRLVPDRNQKISAAGKDMLVVRIVKGTMARLTLFLRPDDWTHATENDQGIVRAGCLHQDLTAVWCG